MDETINHRCRCPFCRFLKARGSNMWHQKSRRMKLPQLQRCAWGDCLICRMASAAFDAFHAPQDAIVVELHKDQGLSLHWYIDNSSAPHTTWQTLARTEFFTMPGKSSPDGTLRGFEKTNANGEEIHRSTINLASMHRSIINLTSDETISMYTCRSIIRTLFNSSTGMDRIM